MRIIRMLSAFFRFLYHVEYPDSEQKRFVVLGIRKTIKCDILPVIKQNYQKTTERLKKITRPLRVIFLINETAKWQYQSVYEAMDESGDFDPLVVVVPMERDKTPSAEAEDLYRFFADKKIKAEYGYDIKTKKFLPLDIFSPDVVFYQQPWPIEPEQNIAAVSEYALCCYCSYSIVESFWGFGFTRGLAYYFVVDDTVKGQILSYGNGHNNTVVTAATSPLLTKAIYGGSQLDNIVVTGSPKLEAAAQVVARHVKQSDKPTIIYAPHHSFEKKATSLHWATFEWSGPAVLRLAAKYTGFNWILKPHPRFDYAVVHNGVMTRQQITDWYAEWEKHGSITTGGDYFDLFAESDLMITDCGAFLWEYFLTRKPLICLLQPSGTPRAMREFYYNAENELELNDSFDDLFINHRDPKKEQREQAPQPFLFEGAASKILRVLSEVKNGGK